MAENNGGNDWRARGWRRLPFDPEVAAWTAALRPSALALLTDPEHAHWWRCEGTWFAGVNALANDADGALPPDVPPLPPRLRRLAEPPLGRAAPIPLDRAQISAVRAGYPRPRAGESAAAFAYRRDRDAAHVDGLLAQGPGRRRHLGERHAYLLGLPLTEAPPGAAPLAVWEGSHEVIRAALAAALADTPPESWGEADLTDVYHAARRRCFETLPRRLLPVRPGEALIVHRLALHGVSPWDAPPGADRVIAYFRPAFPPDASAGAWLAAP